MNNEILKCFQTIGKLTKIINPNSSLDEILKSSISAILEDVPSDYVVVWFSDNEVLRPYYWIGDKDFTVAYHNIGDGIVGKAFQDRETVYLSNGNIKEICFEDEEIRYEICMPFENKHEQLGCIQFIRTTIDKPYTDENRDVCEIFSNYLAFQIEENPNVIKKDNGNIILSARNIEKTFINGEIESKVLKGVNIDVFEGELLVVLGESGCGKSTFLNIIGGMETCDGGNFTFMGKDMTKATRQELTEYRRNNIGFIFQGYNLMPNLTAQQNIDLIGELVKDPMDSMEALKLVGLDSKYDRYPAQLSGGQQQRISIARALVKRPKLIFADEPTAALDYATSIEVLSVLSEVIKTGTTVVMVTHNEEITKMANRVVRMRNGKSYEIVVNKHPLDATDLVW